MSSLPNGMSTSEVQLLLNQRRLAVTKQLIKLKRERNELNERIARYEAELEANEQGQAVLADEY